MLWVCGFIYPHAEHLPPPSMPSRDQLPSQPCRPRAWALLTKHDCWRLPTLPSQLTTDTTVFTHPGLPHPSVLPHPARTPDAMLCLGFVRGPGPWHGETPRPQQHHGLHPCPPPQGSASWRPSRKFVLPPQATWPWPGSIFKCDFRTTLSHDRCAMETPASTPLLPPVPLQGHFLCDLPAPGISHSHTGKLGPAPSLPSSLSPLFLPLSGREEGLSPGLTID